MREWIEQMAGMEASCAKANGSSFNYAGICDFLLDRGFPQPDSAALTEEQFEYLTKVAKATTLPFEAKQCFHNAMMLVVMDSRMEGRIEFVEGYCFSGALPVHHAWVELDGKLVDLTRSLRPEAAMEFIDGKKPQADLRDRVLGEIPDGWEYLGVKFDSDEVADYVWEYEETNSLILNYREGYPKLMLARIKPMVGEVERQASKYEALHKLSS